jgi:LysM repeat protein
MNERFAVWSLKIGGGVAAVLGLAMASGCITSGATQPRIQAPRATQLGSFVPPPYISPGGTTKPLKSEAVTSVLRPGPLAPAPFGTGSILPPKQDKPTPPRPSHLTYKVKKGDSLSEIAAMYKVSVDELASVNDMKKSDVLRVDRVLKIPFGGVAPKGGGAKVAAVKDDDGGAKWHVVEKGDSLSKIAVEHKVKLNKLFEFNHLGPRDVLQIGEKIALNEAAAKDVKHHEAVRTSSGAKKPIPSSGVHVVKPNESWWVIAHQYQGLDSAKLQDFNPGVKSLHPGDTLYLTEGAAKTHTDYNKSKLAGEKVADLPADNKYTIQPGDSLERISHKFGVAVSKIMADNNLKDHTIFPGTTLILKRDASAAGSGSGKDINERVVRNPKGPEALKADTDADSLTGKTMLPHFVDQSSDTLEDIAEMYGSKVKWITLANPKIKSNTDLKQVKEIQVPVPVDDLNVAGPAK